MRGMARITIRGVWRVKPSNEFGNVARKQLDEETVSPVYLEGPCQPRPPNPPSDRFFFFGQRAAGTTYLPGRYVCAMR